MKSEKQNNIPTSPVNPQRIILARESRGLQQSELASRLGVTQGKISKMESGMLGVSEQMLDSFARELSYPHSFFFESGEIYPLGINYYRKAKGTSSKTLKTIEAFVNLRREDIEKLLRSVEVSKEREIRYCDIDDDRYGNPEAIARATRKFWNLPRGPVNNVVALLEGSGVLIVECDFGTRFFSGVSTISRGGDHIIFVNSTMPGDRLRFTLAHELGHIIMHQVTTETMEEEADRFASELLMPADDIKPQLSRISLDRLGSLKLHWKVSMGAILKRASTLRMLTERQYRYLWMQMGKHGFRLNEPIEYNIAREKPSLVKETIQIHLNELGFTKPQLSRVLNMHDDEFSSVYELRKTEHAKLHLEFFKPNRN